MRIKTALVSTVFLSTLLAGTALAPDALAQKGALYNPTSSWAVSKVSGNGGNGYCALARRFEKNTILTVARNQADEFSIAFDFQRPKLNANQTLIVTLDPGAGQQRNFNIRPSSSNALVVRLGQDETFFAALEKTGYLRAEIGPKSYHFNLADIDAGQSDLRACVSAMTQPAAGGPSSASANITPYPFDASVGYVPKAASSDIRALEAENEKLRLTLAEVKSQNYRSSENFNHKSAESTERLKRENAQLKHSLALVQGGAEASQELKAEIAALKTQNEQLRRLSAENTDVAKRGLVLSLTEENRRLQQELDQVASSVTPQETQAVVSSLEQENDALRRNLEEARNAPAPEVQGGADIDRLNAQIWDLKAQNVELRAQAQIGYQNVIARYENKLRAEKATNKKLQEALDNQGIDAGLIDALRAQLGQLKNEKGLLQQTAAQARAQAVRDKNAEISALKSELQQVEASGDSVFALKSQLEKIVKERDTFKMTAKAQRDQIASLKNSFQPAAETQALEAKVAILTDENERLHSEVELSLLGHDTDVDIVSTEIIALEQENLALNAQVERYAAQAQDFQAAKAELAQIRAYNDTLVEQVTLASAGSGDLSVNLEKVLADNETLKMQLNKRSGDFEQLGDLATKIETLEGENAALQLSLGGQVTSGEQKLAEAQAFIDALQDQNETLQVALNEQHDLNTQLNLASMGAVVESGAGNTDLEDKIAILEVENDKLVRALEGALAEASEYRTVMMSQPNVQSAALDDVNAEIEGLKGENAVLKEHISQAENELTRVLSGAAPVQTGAAPMVVASAPKVNPKKEGRGMSAGGMLSVAENLNAIETAAGEMDDEIDQAYDAVALVALDNAPASVIEPGEEQLQERIKQELQEQMDEKNAALPTGPGAEDILSAGIGIGARVDDGNLTERASLAQDPVLNPQIAAGLTEAQKQEQILMQRLDEGAAPVIATRSEDLSAPFTLVEEPEMDVESYFEVELAEVIETDAVISEAPATLSLDTIEPVTTSGAFAPAFTVNTMLSDASITAVALDMIEQASGPDRVVYQWTADNVYGSSEQKPLRNEADFENYVREYLTKTENRCQGDFAVLPDDTGQFGETRVDSYEVACIGANVNSSASLVFFNKEGTFTVVAHEAPTEYMDGAMALRDRVRDTVSGT